MMGLMNLFSFLAAVAPAVASVTPPAAPTAHLPTHPIDGIPADPIQAAASSILVAGSLNLDTFLPVSRFPRPGENLTLLKECEANNNKHGDGDGDASSSWSSPVDVPGGKGCNQAIACAKLRRRRTVGVSFLGQFGNDGHAFRTPSPSSPSSAAPRTGADLLKHALVSNGVDVSHCEDCPDHPSGRGYVLIVPRTGEVSAVIDGGSNWHGWGRWGANEGRARDGDDGENDDANGISDEEVRRIVRSHAALLLQCEIPEFVNLRLAEAAKDKNEGDPSAMVPVLHDAGGEDRIMSKELLRRVDFLIPNESELERLAASYPSLDEDATVELSETLQQQQQRMQQQLGPSLDLNSILSSIRILQRHGANHVLVTLGSRGSLLALKPPTPAHPSRWVYQPALPLPPGRTALDETGAGDCYRAGFAVALLEHGYCRKGEREEKGYGTEDTTILRRCMKFASAAGALAVTKRGAVPSIPSREEVEDFLRWVDGERDGDDGHDIDSSDEVSSSSRMEAIPRGGTGDDPSPSANTDDNTDKDDDFPFLFGSRLNSMKDRLDLLDPSQPPPSTPRDYVLRQSQIRGLGCIDFNYPQHFQTHHWTPLEAKQTLDRLGLRAGAVCLRYPPEFARGAMNHPDPSTRRKAIELTKRAAEVAKVLGANEVVVWSAYDGYDYPFQVDYREKWTQLVDAFRECCDAHPDVKWSLEFKPTDENTRFFTVPSTGAAMMLVKEIDRPNMGLTLDMGHMLMAGENPGQSVAMVGDKLFGIQLNDGYTRLAAEDGMMFGSIHPSMALEVMYQLRRIGFKGHFYFDTFPQRTDPVKEAEYNIRRVKEFWRAVGNMDENELENVAREHDALGALKLVDDALRR